MTHLDKFIECVESGENTRMAHTHVSASGQCPCCSELPKAIKIIKVLRDALIDAKTDHFAYCDLWPNPTRSDKCTCESHDDIVQKSLKKADEICGG